MTSMDLAKIDFDAFDEEKVLEEIKENPGIKTVFSKSFFAAEFEDGTRVGVPLELTRDLVNNISAEVSDPFDQVEMLLKALGLDSELEKVVCQGMRLSIVFARRYFEALEKVQQASLGK